MTATDVMPILVATCGNTLAGDDAFGPLVAQRLMAEKWAGVEVVDLGMRPGGLIDHLAGRKAVILVDAARCSGGGGGEEGELVDWDFFAPGRPVLCADRVTSTHALSLAGQLELARALGMLPAVVRVVALVAQRTAVGTVGEKARGRVEEAVNLIKKWVERCMN
jgi:hydrogenase maturation protease